MQVGSVLTKGDFTADRRLIWITLLAIPVGLVCAVVALVLQRLIALFTNLFYNVRIPELAWDTHNGWFTNLLHNANVLIPGELISPADSRLPAWLLVLIPVIGGLAVGLMARYGSERIRGHGIPEALEAILIGQSRMSPRVAVLKPLSSAISIGSGGPFGAEGPIIMTGGACGSIFAQAFNLSAAERKTLLVAGAAGGMAATFGTPLAAVLLAVELLLFEWKPRSLVPVALASAIAALARPYLAMGAPPLFHVALHNGVIDWEEMLSATIVGVLAGIMALLLTLAVYAAEDAFHRLPFHWMWWPAIGGLAVGIGGLIEPQALGVGYDIIEKMLQGDYVPKELAALMVVKCLIWAIALGSGTSGGVLAPLLIMGGALGALESSFLPGGDARLWPLVSMAAVMGGTMRSPLTGIIFAMELTYDIRTLPALLIACAVSHAFTVLVMRRSILTEKVARRGYHVSREYSVDPLERLSLGEVMSIDVVTVPASLPVRDLVQQYFLGERYHKHQGYPVLDAQGRLLGVVTKSNLLDDWIIAALKSGPESEIASGPIITYDLLTKAPVTAFPWESCRVAAERMAVAGVGRVVIVKPEDATQVIGIITRSDLLKPRAQLSEEEQKRDRPLLPSPVPVDGIKAHP